MNYMIPSRLHDNLLYKHTYTVESELKCHLRQQNTLVINYTAKMSLAPDDCNGGVFKLSYYSYRGRKKLHYICCATCIYRTVF